MAGTSHSACSADQRCEHAREHVGVLVGVNVGDGDAGGLDATDLRDGLALDFRSVDAAAEEVDHELGEAGAETSTGRERWKLAGMERRVAIHENNVAADSERCLHEGGVRGVAKGCPGGHQCRGGQDFEGIQFQDGAVHAFRQTEIIRVDDKAALCRLRDIHATSLASVQMPRLLREGHH